MDKSLQREIHPLLINHVVERIFKYEASQCPSSLLALRHVCQVWNQVAVKCFLKHSKQVITFGKHFRGVEDLQEITADIKQTEDGFFPQSHFKFCPDIFQAENELHIRNFFKTSCYTLQTLIIRLDEQSTLSICPEQWKDIELPMLSSFVYDDRRNVSRAFDDVFPLFLKCSKNLTGIAIHRKQTDLGYSQEDAQQFGNMILRICTALKESRLNSLKSLQVEVKLNDAFLNNLANLFLRLENLSICLKTSHFEPDSLFNLLKSHVATLQRLKLCGLCRKSEYEIRFPRMKKLQVLEIHGWCHVIPFVKFKTFCLQETFPNLKELVLDTWSGHPSWFQFLGKGGGDFGWVQQASLVTKLKLPQEFFDVQLVQKIPLSFNNLKTLHIHFHPTTSTESESILEKVFQCLQNLEELRIFESFCEFTSPSYIDTVLTGIPAEDCKKLLRTNKPCEVLQENVERKPSLLLMKSLKILDLKDLLKHQAIITDVSGNLFLGMKSLQNLHIVRSKIRQHCFAQLCKKFPKDLSNEMETLDSDENAVSRFRSCVIS